MVIAILACAPLVSGWAPLDMLAGLFGTQPLHSLTTEGQQRLIDEAEHVACHKSSGYCLPAAGCTARAGGCEPKIGHYWKTPSEPGPSMGVFDSVLPPIPAPWYIKTARGVLAAKPGFFFTSYKILGESAESESDAASLPGIPTGYWTFCCVTLPGFVLFFFVTYAGRT